MIAAVFLKNTCKTAATDIFVFCGGLFIIWLL